MTMNTRRPSRLTSQSLQGIQRVGERNDSDAILDTHNTFHCARRLNSLSSMDETDPFFGPLLGPVGDAWAAAEAPWKT